MLTSLQRLKLGTTCQGMAEVDPHELLRLSALVSLQALTLWELPIAGGLFRVLAGCSQLTQLSLHGCELGDPLVQRQMQQLAPQLLRLRILGCRYDEVG